MIYNNDKTLNWWLILLNGFLTFFFGVIILVNKLDAFMIFVMYLVVMTLLWGVYGVSESISKAKRKERWGADLTFAILNLIAFILILLMGVYFPFFVAFSLWVFVYMLAAWMIIGGIYFIVTAFERAEHKGLMITLGFLQLLLGIVFMFNPFATLLTLSNVLAVMFLAVGMFKIIFAFSVKGVFEEVEKPYVIKHEEEVGKKIITKTAKPKKASPKKKKTSKTTKK